MILLSLTIVTPGFSIYKPIVNQETRYSTAKESWKAISIAGAIGIKADGTLWKWNNENKPSIEQIGFDKDWINVYGSGGSYIAMKNNGALWSWGRDADGQLGYKSTGNRHIMNQIGRDKWKEVSKGTKHVFAIKNDGTLWGWGENGFGRFITDSKVRAVFEPLQIGRDSNWIHVSTSEYQTLLLKSDGTLWTIYKEETGMFQSYPVQFGTDYNWETISADYNRNFAIKKDGTLWAWGNSQGSLLGFDVSSGYFAEPVLLPTQLGTDNKWQSVCSGELYTLALKKDGTLWSWGYGPQHGQGNYEQIISPQQLGNETDWVYIDASYGNSVAIKSNGTAWFWGKNLAGHFGFSSKGDNILTPTQLQ